MGKVASNKYQGSRIKVQGSRFKCQGTSVKEQVSRNKCQGSRIKEQGLSKEVRIGNTNKDVVFDLGERMAGFGEGAIAFCRSIKADIVTRPLVSQLVRSATSIGANYSEAGNASSRKDFRNKVYIAKKEAQETKYWLRMLGTCCPEGYEEDLHWLRQEAHELTLILQSITAKVDAKEDL